MSKLSMTMLVPLLLLAGCSSTQSGDKLLPDTGPTTVELIRGGQSVSNHVYYGSGIRADYQGIPLAAGYAPNSTHSLAHVHELQRDFHQIPNPQIVAYVYPHLVGGELPVPGYFTVFNLYERDYYALETEGHHVYQ